MLSSQPRICITGEASNGQEAIRLVRHLKPDVIIMDISMPRMNGVEATWQIKREFPNMRVVGLSMYYDEQAAESMHNAGADAFLSKTASSAELLKAIYND